MTPRAAARAVATIGVAVAVVASTAGCGSGGAGSAQAPGASPTGSASLPVSSSPSEKDVQVTVRQDGVSVTVTTGQTVQVLLPPSAQLSGVTTAYAVRPPNSTALVAVPGSPGVFDAEAPGTASVVVTQSPICSPGLECPAHIIDIGQVTVNVTA